MSSTTSAIVPQPASSGTVEGQTSQESTGRLGNIFQKAGSLVGIAILAAVAYLGHESDWTYATSNGFPVSDLRASANVEIPSVRFVDDPSDFEERIPGIDRDLFLTFRSVASLNAAGIDVAPVWRTRLIEAVTVGGESTFDPTRVTRLSTRTPGTAVRVFKTRGDPVRAGEVLTLVDAVEVGRAKADLLTALVRSRLRSRELANIRAGGTALSEQQLREAEAATREAETHYQAAEQTLINLGLSPATIVDRNTPTAEAARRLRLLGVPDSSGYDVDTATANLLPVVAPHDGVVLSADVVTGEVVTAGVPLFVIVDPSVLWLLLHVPLDVVHRVSIGQEITFQPDDAAGELQAVVTWVGTAADETTRTVPVRAEVSNPVGRLRASVLGRGRIVVRKSPDAVVVPTDAVRTFRGMPIVFVRHPNYFEPGGPKGFFARAVTVGIVDGVNTEIVTGLTDGEVVATKGVDLLMTGLSRFAAEKTASLGGSR